MINVHFRFWVGMSPCMLPASPLAFLFQYPVLGGLGENQCILLEAQIWLCLRDRTARQKLYIFLAQP